MTPSEIKAILIKMGGRPNKKLGQHFLIDPSALQAVVNTAAIKPGDHVLEVGPGLGVLTRALIERGAEVTAIEQDRRFVEYLTEATVIHGDAVALHWHELVGDRPWKFVSNLPYSITSLALRKALWTPKPPEIVVVLIQREVAERAVAKNGKTSLLSLMVALASSAARIVKRVAPGAFYPPPKVESAILEIIPMDRQEGEKKWGIDPEKIMQVAKKGFAHPRKFLFSNLGIKADASIIREIEKIVGIHPKARAEDVSPEQWAKLTKMLMESLALTER